MTLVGGYGMGLFGRKNKDDKENKGFSAKASEVGETIDSKPQTFDELMDHFESMGKQNAIDKCFKILNETVPKLDRRQVKIYTMFMFWSVSVDGTLTEEEFLITETVFSFILNQEKVSYEYARGFVEGMSHRDAIEYGSDIALMTKALLSELDSKLALGVLTTGILLSACDGKICNEERQFLRTVIHG